MKWNSLLFLILFLIVSSNSTQAEEKWVKTKSGCHIWWDHSPSGMFKAVTWKGKCKNGYASGSGRLTYHMKDSSQDLYTGDVKKGKPHGYGRYVWSNKNVYAGHWKNGKMDGQGTHTWANGERYTGTWKNNYMHGKGIYTLANGKTKQKKEKTNNLNEMSSTYLNLLSGYSINRHLHYGN